MTNEPVSHRTVTVKLENGLHLVPCSQIAQRAGGFGCDVVIRKGDQTADAKNIFDLMSLCAERNTELSIEARGSSATEAVDQLAQLFETNFAGEEAGDA